MGAVLHPVGSNTANVYWRRRIFVLAVLVVLLIVGVLLIRSCTEGEQVAAPTLVPSASPTSESGPQACNPANIDLSIAGFQRVKVGDTQSFQLVAQNTSPHICILEISPKTTAVNIVSGKERVWSTNDCDTSIEKNTVTLEPAKSYEFSLDLELRRSQPNCTSAKNELKAGTYTATVSWQSTTAKQSFQIVK